MSDADTIPELVRLKEVSERLWNPELAVKILDALPDALVVVDEPGRIIIFNQKAELLFGYSRVEVFGQPVEMLVPEAKRAAHVGHRQKYADQPQVRGMGVDLQLAAKHKTRGEFPVKINLSPIVTVDGTFACAVVRRTDV